MGLGPDLVESEGEATAAGLTAKLSCALSRIGPMRPSRSTTNPIGAARRSLTKRRFPDNEERDDGASGGGSVWESNPPEPPKAPPSRF